MSALRIGITIGLRSSQESLWSNGIKQNAAFLAMALRHVPQVRSVVLVNTTALDLTRGLPWRQDDFPTLPFDQAKDHLDVLIELGGQVSGEQTAYLHARGCRLVSYACGAEYVMATQAMIFNRPLWHGQIYVNPAYDDVWMIPQLDPLTRPFLEVFRRQAVTAVPFVWSPLFLQERTKGHADAGVWRSKPGAKRLTVMEPNHDVLKFCLYPALIAELAFRQRPDLIELLQITNTHPMAMQNADFIALMNQLDIVKAGKAVFLGRHDTPTFLAEHTDAVISHQWDNPLNYFYLEVCWQGYPLIHNAHLCADLGYFYPAHDLAKGADLLLDALQHHAQRAADYQRTQRERIARFLPDNAELVGTYAALLQRVMKKPPRV